MSIASDGLAALTILIAESKPEEKEIMVAVTMNMTGKKEDSHSPHSAPHFTKSADHVGFFKGF